MRKWTAKFMTCLAIMGILTPRATLEAFLIIPEVRETFRRGITPTAAALEVLAILGTKDSDMKEHNV